jgi:hypothetical protein
MKKIIIAIIVISLSVPIFAQETEQNNPFLGEPWLMVFPSIDKDYSDYKEQPKNIISDIAFFEFSFNSNGEYTRRNVTGIGKYKDKKYLRMNIFFYLLTILHIQY